MGTYATGEKVYYWPSGQPARGSRPVRVVGQTAKRVKVRNIDHGSGDCWGSVMYVSPTSLTRPRKDIA